MAAEGKPVASEASVRQLLDGELAEAFIGELRAGYASKEPFLKQLRTRPLLMEILREFRRRAQAHVDAQERYRQRHRPRGLRQRRNR